MLQGCPAQVPLSITILVGKRRLEGDHEMVPNSRGDSRHPPKPKSPTEYVQHN